MLPPLGHLVKHGVVGSEELLPRQIVVVPVHHHLAAAHIIGRRGAQAGKKGALHGAGDDKGLPLLHMKPHFNEELCVFTQFFVHGVHYKHFLFLSQNIFLPQNIHEVVGAGGLGDHHHMVALADAGIAIGNDDLLVPGNGAHQHPLL